DLRERKNDLTQAERNIRIKQGLLEPTPADKFTESTIPQEQEQDKKDQIAALPSTKGLTVREAALGRLSKTDPHEHTVIWVVRGLFLMVELAPLLLKRVSPATVYEANARLRAVRSAERGRVAYQEGLAVDAEAARHEAQAQKARTAWR